MHAHARTRVVISAALPALSHNRFRNTGPHVLIASPVYFSTVTYRSTQDDFLGLELTYM